jgi:hypothetical protein
MHNKVDGTKTFDRNWTDYKIGFRDAAGNYWIGNDRLNMLTKGGGYKIRFEVFFPLLLPSRSPSTTERYWHAWNK